MICPLFSEPGFGGFEDGQDWIYFSDKSLNPPNPGSELFLHSQQAPDPSAVNS